jgi:hypothetical protein
MINKKELDKDNQNLIEIYSMSRNSPSLMDIKPSSVRRDWMDGTSGMAYHCLPLNIANQYGWVCHNIKTFTATWDGGISQDSLKIDINQEREKSTQVASSHFGHGIITIPTDFLVKTPENVSIYIRGVSNHNYENVYPLDGIVESDWLPFTFTMNYKFSKPGSVTFKKGDPLFMFFPIDRRYIENFDIVQKPISSNEDLMNKYNKYGKARSSYIDSKTNSKGQKFYVSGNVVDEKAIISNHKRTLKLKIPKLDFN